MTDNDEYYSIRTYVHNNITHTVKTVWKKKPVMIPCSDGTEVLSFDYVAVCQIECE